MDEAFLSRLTEGKSIKIFVAKAKILRRCNLRCKKCTSWHDGIEEDLPLESLRQIIEMCARHGCHVINLLGGEPTLYPGLFDAIALISSFGVRCGLTTNGQLIDDEYAQRLKDAGLRSIRVSLDSHRPEIHDAVVDVAGAWTRTTEAIKILVHRLRRVSLNCVLGAFNLHEIPEMIRFAHDLGVREVIFMPYEDTGIEQIDSSLRLPPGHFEELGRKSIPRVLELCHELGMTTNFARAFQYANECGRSIKEKLSDLQVSVPCFLPFYRIEVERSGNVFPCCEMNDEQHVMGNLLEQDFDAVVYGKKYMDFRRGLLPPLSHPRCRRCWIAIDDNLEILRELGGSDASAMLLKMIERTEHDASFKTEA